MALTLLELVSRAGQGEEDADVESTWSTRLKPSVATTSDFTVLKGKKKVIRGVEVEYFEDLIVRKEEGWEVKAPSVEDEEKVVAGLRRKVDAGLTMGDFVSMVRPVLEGAARRDGGDAVENGGEKGNPLRESGETDEEVLMLGLLRRGAPHVGRKLLAALVNCILGLRFWKGLKVLMEGGMVTSASHPELMQKLVEQRKADCITLCFYYVLDLTPSDIMMALKFFLETSNASRNGFEVVRQQWRRVAMAAVDYAVDRKRVFAKREEAIERELREKHAAEKQSFFLRNPLAIISAVDDFELPIEERERRLRDQITNSSSTAVNHAVVMSMAVDGFEGWETCLHALVASGQDEAILAAIIRELETSEAVRLLQYLRKWLDRYSNRLSRFPSPKNKSKHPVHNVPSSQQVLQWVNMVLDGQYTKCVLSSEFLPELKAIQKSVDSVVAIGRKLVPMVGMVEHLREKHPMPARRQDSAANSDYTIEYLDIS
ncbi:hypothetical protein KC19_9G159400 [Ceratodon purpureus]|uniref:Nucleolar protein 11 C-terminal domain-containing protein n=1 Tax=Ceratodon purpureus TaxID=3225 RepID=A0A8T0GSG2_CERPU|nr:hypothetical protein KC19_9G159400 [Ceratodon purpureus]